jgi:hypothetical protein
MAAGSGFKTFATGDVLTAADTNGYLMQGVWVFADAAARTAAVTSPQEGNMSYLKDTNSTEYYSGSAWVAVAPASSGGMTSIASGSLSTGTLSLTGISGSYKDLRLVLRNYYQSTASTFKVTVNSVTSYDWFQILNAASGGGGALTVETGLAQPNINTSYNSPSTSSTASAFSANFYDYTNTTANKLIDINFGYLKNTGGARELVKTSAIANTTAAITSITLTQSGGTFSGGTYILYGIN